MTLHESSSKTSTETTSVNVTYDFKLDNLTNGSIVYKSSYHFNGGMRINGNDANLTIIFDNLNKTNDNDSLIIYSMKGTEIDSRISSFNYTINEYEGTIGQTVKSTSQSISLLPSSDSSKVILTVYQK